MNFGNLKNVRIVDYVIEGDERSIFVFHDLYLVRSYNSDICFNFRWPWLIIEVMNSKSVSLCTRAQQKYKDIYNNVWSLGNLFFLPRRSDILFPCLLMHTTMMLRQIAMSSSVTHPLTNTIQILIISIGFHHSRWTESEQVQKVKNHDHVKSQNLF